MNNHSHRSRSTLINQSQGSATHQLSVAQRQWFVSALTSPRMEQSYQFLRQGRL